MVKITRVGQHQNDLPFESYDKDGDEVGSNSV